MRKILALSVLAPLLFVGSASAQTVIQGGPWAPRHAPAYTPAPGASIPFVQDSGPAGGGPSSSAPGISEGLYIVPSIMGQSPPYANSGTGPYQTNWCDYDGPITSPSGYHYLCLSPNAAGGGLIAFGAVGSAPQLPLYAEFNGTKYPFPFVLPGTGVIGPVTTTIGNVAGWANTAGTLVGDTAPGTLSVISSGSTTGRTLSARFAEQYNILDYGAQCNGTGNDGTAIQAAVNEAQGNGGGMVKVPVSVSGCAVTGTISITAGSVSISGASGIAGFPTGTGQAELVFNNGSADDIDIGGGASQINGDVIEDLTIDHVAKTGGYIVSCIYTNHCGVRDVWATNAFNGLYFDRINNSFVRDSSFNITVPGGQYGICFCTTNSGAGVRSDVLWIESTTIQMGGTSGGEGFRIDGFSNDVHADHFQILGATNYAIHIANTSGSSSYFPGFGLFNDLEIDAQYKTAILIEAGDNWQFIQSVVDSIKDTNPADPIVRITGDIGASYTRQIYFIDSYIADGPGECVNIQAYDSIISGSTLADCGKYAGVHGQGGPTAEVPVIEVGPTTAGLNVHGNILGYVFGQCCSGSNNYAVQVDAGASRVLFGNNTYELYDGTAGTFQDASGHLTVVGGGLDYNGQPFGAWNENVSGAGGVNSVVVNNPSSTSGTVARLGAATGTANNYLALSVDDANRIVTLANGSGATNGVNLFTSTGPLNLNPTGAVQVNGTNAVTCPPGAPSSSFASVKGIVTHC